MPAYRPSRQLGAIPFKLVLVIGGSIFMLITLFALAAAPPKSNNPKQSGSSGSSSSQQQGQQAAQSAGQQSGNQKTAPAAAYLRLPDGFRRFTSNDNQFSLAYPESWGSLLSLPNQADAALLAQTKDVTYPLGTAQLAGNLSIAVYIQSGLSVAVNQNGATVAPVQQGNKLTWKVTAAASVDDTYRVGNPYPVTSYTNPSGVTVYDLSWNTPGGPQSRWLIQSADYYTIMSLPPLSRTDHAAPTDQDTAFYKDFARKVMDTVYIPQ